MSGDIDERPVWDEAVAANVIGKVVLVGLTYLEADGSLTAQQQFFGTVVSADSRQGILLALKGRRAGERYNLPPDTRAIEIASAGEYRLRATGEVVTDPDYTFMFSVVKEDENNGGRRDSALALRRASAEDVEFAFRVLKETMREYAIATWGTWWEDESRRQTVEQVSSGRTEIIELNDLPVGIQLVERAKTHIQLVQLYIAKEFQRRGIGSQVVQRLLRESSDSKLPVRLRVLAVNPARAFYERLGFTLIESTPERHFMEWVPNISIRKATGADAGQISGLLRSLSHTFTTYADGRGAEAFFAMLTEPAISGVLANNDAEYWVAESKSAVVAVAGLRGNERISHLFIDPKYQGLGLARKLWEILRDQALRAGNPGVFTVNSSLVAVPVYQRLGFVVAGAKVEKDGGAYVPMRLERASGKQ